MRRDSQSFLWIDETATELENDRTVADDDELRDHIKLIHHAFEFMNNVIRKHEYTSDEELTVLRLGIRAFNSAASALKLGRSGYYQPALAMVRDIVEVQFLIDLFRRDSQKLRRWMSANASEREREFKLVAVREHLDRLDGYKEKRRAQAYKLFSSYAAHVTPDGFRIISPAGMTQIGPFPSREVLTALIQELAKHFSYTCVLFGTAIKDPVSEILVVKAAFLRTLDAWAGRYLRH